MKTYNKIEIDQYVKGYETGRIGKVIKKMTQGSWEDLSFPGTKFVVEWCDNGEHVVMEPYTIQPATAIDVAKWKADADRDREHMDS